MVVGSRPPVFETLLQICEQVASAKRSAPGWGIGSNQRFKYDYIVRAKQLPGAGTYSHTAACGDQAQSSKRTLPKYGFGSSTRDKLKKVTFLLFQRPETVEGYLLRLL